MSSVEERLAALEATVASNTSENNTFYLLWASGLVFLMQAGFAMLSAGSIRAKNVKNILLKSVLDACLGGIVWYFIGYGVAYGGDSIFIGNSPANFGLSQVVDTGATHAFGYDWVMFFFQYCFCAACATIVSGAVAERCQLGAYLIYFIVIIGFIYPVVVHWVWDTAGFLCGWNPTAVMGGMIDFAGSGVVHMTGGWAALVAAKVVGPRLGRFEAGIPDSTFSGHSAALQVLGTFLLWFGWYGFNPGSTLMIHGAARDAARCAVTTTLSACAGAVIGLFVKRLFPAKLGGTPGVWDLGHTCNSLLGGLVGITAGTSVTTPAGAVIIGSLSALVYHGASCLMRKLKIDDPLDAYAVHGACGAWGCIAVGFFAVPAYSYAGDGATVGGVFYGGSGRLLGIQVVGVLIEIAWVCTTTTVLFLALKMAGILRTSADVERAGMDVSKHGGHAYPTDVAQ